MKTKLSLYVTGIILFFCLSSSLARSAEQGDLLISLTRGIPPRPAHAMSGSEFARYVSPMTGAEREAAIVSELLKGNIPALLRKLKPVHLLYRVDDRRTAKVTFFTMPDYLAIGSEEDYLLMPMNLRSALAVALNFGFTLPTKKMVDAIYQQSDSHFTPSPLPACPEMTSTEYYAEHNRMILEQRVEFDVSPDALVSGHKKDVVLTNRMARYPERVPIYGWQRRSGVPIQPLSLVHGAGYADYSHGIRLVSDMVLINDTLMSIYQLLQDHLLAGVLSGEGPMPFLARLLRLPASRLSALEPPSDLPGNGS